MLEFQNTEGKHIWVRTGWVIAIYENAADVYSVWVINGHAHNVTKETALRLVDEILAEDGDGWRHG